jgi:hypothetical protein
MAAPDPEIDPGCSHTSSIAVWDVRSPVVIAEDVTAKVGVKCSASCCLAGQQVEVRDDAGRPVASGVLGEKPWAGTVALYVAEVTVVAPPQPGVLTYVAHFVPESLASNHSAAHAPFNIIIALPPAHTITVEVTDRFTGTPVEDMAVRCDVYRAVTNSGGVARLQVPSGTFELSAWKSGYDDVAPRIVRVSEDLVLRVQSAPSPERNADDESVWM